MKKFLSLFLSLAMLLGIITGLNLTASAETLTGSCGENVTYSLDTETGVLTISGSGDMKNYNDNGSPFYKNSNIKSVVIETGVTSIGDCAFTNCESLTSVTIPNSVTSIGDCAFSDCESLTSITIPDSVISIGWYAFSSCTSLTEINVDLNNTNYSSQDGVLFNKDKTRLIQYPIGNARTSYSIPDSVTSIGADAFSGCKSLTSVTIPNSVTSIGESAFFNCESLTSITIPDSVTSIGYEAFSDCTSLTSVTIPDSVTSIGGYAFLACTSLTSVTIPDSVTSIGDWAFLACTSLTEINVDSNNTSYSSQNCVLFNKDKTELIQYPIGNARTSYSIPDSVTSIGDRAFYECTSLTSVTIPDSVTSIGESAFARCTNLKSIAIPNGVNYIADSTFHGCENLTDIIIPVSVTCIGYCVFTDCNNLSIHYSGTKKQWDKIFIDNFVSYLDIDATIYYNEKISNKQKNTKVKKATPAKASATISWSNVKGVKGYEVQLATDKKFKKNVKSKTINKQKTTKTTVKNLKSKTKYYVRIRTYKMSKGTKVYSTWSSAKTVKTK